MSSRNRNVTPHRKGRLHAFVGDPSVSVKQARLNVGALKHGVAVEDLFDRAAGGQHSKDVLHGDAPAADDGLASQNVRAGGDPAQ